MHRKVYKNTAIGFLITSILFVPWLVFGIFTAKTPESDPVFSNFWKVSVPILGVFALFQLILSAVSYIIYSLKNRSIDSPKKAEKVMMNLIVSIPLAAVLVFATFPFAVKSEGMSFSQRMAVGGQNQLRVAIGFTVFSLVAGVLLRKIKSMNLVGIFLGIYCVIGYCFIFAMAVITPKNYLCQRTTPYNNAPEFERSISLITQRFQIERGLPYHYCLYFEYTDLGDGVEGAFLFDKESDPQKLTIFVNNNYKSKDDLLTSLLLVHELTHVDQHINEMDSKGPHLTCFNKEVDAFISEVNLLNSFNQEEQSSLRARIGEYYNASGNTPTASLSGMNYENIVGLDTVRGEAYDSCKKTVVIGTADFNVCYTNNMKEAFYSIISNDPGYQKQCSTQ